MSILVLINHDNNEIKETSANALAAAKILAEKSGLDISVLVAGLNCQSIVNKAALIPGISSVLFSDCATLEYQLSENLAPLVVETIDSHGFTYFLAAATSEGKNLLPRVSALLDVAQLSDVSDIIDCDTFIRPIYAGNALETVQSSDSIKVISVRTASFNAVDLVGVYACETKQLSAANDLKLSRYLSEDINQSERPELTSAKVVISGGRGMQSAEGFKLIESLADELGAAIGASRAAVDAGYVSNDLQVGQTGKIIAPDLYIAVGISGAIQHLAGMKESKIIVAINQDEEASIFSVADYGLVGDLFELLPQLEAELKQ